MLEPRQETTIEEDFSEFFDAHLRSCARFIAKTWKKGDLPDDWQEKLCIQSGRDTDFVIGYARALQEMGE